MTVNQPQLIATYDNVDFRAPIEYGFALMLSTYGLPYRIIPFSELETVDLADTLVISYGTTLLKTHASVQVHIYASSLFGTDYLKSQSMPATPLPRCDDLPVIYAGKAFQGWVRETQSTIESNIDIIASSFFMVSRYEEVVTPVADRFGRFPASASLAHREGFLHRAIVNEYFDLLWYWISSLQPTLRKKPLWPNGKSFAACITHDVDFFRKYHFPSSILIIGREAVRYRRVSEALRLAVGWVKVLARKERDPFDTFNYMVQMERQYGLTSSFYFKCGGNSPHDSRDTIKRAKVAALARDLEGRGCEIGLHSSHEAYDSYELMSAEKATLDLVIGHRSYGCRQHFMRFKVPETWLLQEQLGFLYDTTMAFADHVGFRCGFCLPFRPFDLLSNRVVNLWELPLTVMEGSLQNKDHQNLRPEEAYNQIVDLIETVETHSGLFVLLWHNSSLEATGQWAGWKAIYEKTMEYISRQSVLVASPERALESYQAAGVGHFQQGSEPRK